MIKDSLDHMSLSLVSLYPFLTLLAVCVLLASRIKRDKASGHGLFPGPPADPILGHLRVMPSDNHLSVFADWAKKFGDVIYVSILGRPIIIVNSAETARELMDKRGANYSDRPHSILQGEMIGLGNILVLLHYGERFRAQRRIMAQYLNSQTVAAYHPLQTQQIKIFLKNILSSPDDFIRHIHRMSAATVVKLAYGHDIVSDKDRYISLAIDATTRAASAGTPGMTLVDIFPVLRYIPSWFPGAGFKRSANVTRIMIDEMIDIPYSKVKEERASGTARPSLIRDFLEDNENMDEELELNVKNVGGVMYAAGVETTEVALTTFFLMMARNPEVVKRAQAEIDEVLGSDHLPTFDDRPSLPYIECILKEVWRINTPGPLGIPHQSIAEDVYRDKLIPAGSMVVANIWQMMRDERYYPDPEKFSPERFLNTDVIANGRRSSVAALNGFNPGDPSTLVFGFGRRKCPGRFFADASVWLTIANILTVFDILPPLDFKTGKEIPPAAEYIFGSSNRPKPFICRITPRSAKHASLISQEQNAWT